MKKIATTTILLLALPIMLSAQTGLTGKWQGKTPNGSGVLLDLSVEKETLNGTLTIDGKTTTITDGKVSKNTFTFKAAHDGQIEALAGEFGGNEIKVWLDRDGSAKALVFKRVKR